MIGARRMRSQTAVLGAALVLAGMEAAAAPAAGAVVVDLAATDPSPVIGISGETEIRLALRGPGPETLPPPRLYASVGKLEAPTRNGPRSFAVRYHLPTTRFPQVALIAAELPAGVAGAAVCRGYLALKLRATASPAFRTDPGASVTVRVAERDFGPVVAAADGEVRVSVVVPPGVRSAVARSVNTFGKTTEQTVDLAPPPFPRLLVLAPPEVIAGDTLEIAVVGVEASGDPLDHGRIGLVGSYGRPHPLGGEPGLARFLIRVPTSLEARVLRLNALLRGEPDTESEAKIPLRPGPVATLTIRPARARLTFGERAATEVFVLARDQHGNPAPARPVSMYVDGRPTATRPLPDGRLATSVNAPPRFDGRSTLLIEAVSPGAYARQDIALGSGRSAALLAAPAPLVLLTPRLGLLLPHGSQAGAALTLDATRPAPVLLPVALELGLSLGYLGRRLRADDGRGFSEVALDGGVLLALVRWPLIVARHLQVTPTAGAGAARLWVRSRQAGHVVAGHDLVFALQLGAELAAPLGPGALTASGRYLRLPLGALSDGNSLQGNGGGLVFDLGYRVGL